MFLGIWRSIGSQFYAISVTISIVTTVQEFYNPDHRVATNLENMEKLENSRNRKFVKISGKT